MGVSKLEKEKQKIERIGQIKYNNSNEKMKIIRYKDSYDIDVEFEDGHVLKNKTYSNFVKGKIKNPYALSVYNIGYLGEGAFSPSIDNKHTNEYRYWKSMIKRCYSEKEQSEHTSYIGCSVCKEWHNFQNFAKWFNENYYTIGDELMCLDKDILIKGNKIYSTETCVFVPQNINKLFIKSDKARGKYPIGVSYDKERNKYISQQNNIKIFLGRFDTPKEAFEVYKIEKEKHIKEVADEYKNKIPKKLYDAMYNWKVDIDD